MSTFKQRRNTHIVRHLNITLSKRTRRRETKTVRLHTLRMKKTLLIRMSKTRRIILVMLVRRQVSRSLSIGTDIPIEVLQGLNGSWTFFVWMPSISGELRDISEKYLSEKLLPRESFLRHRCGRHTMTLGRVWPVHSRGMTSRRFSQMQHYAGFDIIYQCRHVLWRSSCLKTRDSSRPERENAENQQIINYSKLNF